MPKIVSRPNGAQDPKQTFESALARMEDRECKAKIPIVPARQMLEERAIGDAARALAQLWAVVPHRGR